jgi:threonine dehydratase
MPISTPSIKWRNVERLGGNVVLHGNDFDAAKAECLRLATRDGLTFIPPYDNPYVVAGQGTVGMEICRQMTDCDELDGIFASIGGGGLISGIAAYVKRVAKPSVKVIGVETVDGDAMEKSLQKGKRVMLDEVGPFADGTAVRIVGEEPFRLCKQLGDGIIKVNNDEICAAIKDVFEGQFCYLCLKMILMIRNEVHPRTIRSLVAGRSKSTHHPQRPPGQEQAFRRRHFWWKHELWSSEVRRRASRTWRKA